MSSGGGGGGASEKAVNPGSSAGTDKEKMIRNFKKSMGEGRGLGCQTRVCLGKPYHEQSADNGQ